MDSGLARLIADYLAGVVRAVELIKRSGIPLPESDVEWAATNIPQRGKLEGDVAYFKHGYGCAVRLPGGAVDFDFGDRGEINGFNWSRLADFAGPKLGEYGFASEEKLRVAFEAAAQAGSLRYSGYILYYLADAA